MIAYHVTLKENLSGILKKGIIPAVGERSSSTSSSGESLESIPRVYLFPSREDLNTALSQWLGDEFDDVDEFGLIIIEVNIEKLSPYSTCMFEICVEVKISPERIINVYEEDWSTIKVRKHRRHENNLILNE